MTHRHGIPTAAASIFVIGIAILALSYQSPGPILVAVSLGGVVALLFRMAPRLDPLVAQAFLLSFALGTFWSGIAAIYANQFDDPGQIFSDAAYFHEIVKAFVRGDIELANMPSSEQIGPVALWSLTYKLFGLLGLGPSRYIGIAVNTLCVALAASCGAGAMSAIFADPRRTKTFIYLFACFPMAWLFSAVFLRDAFILLILVGYMSMAIFVVSRSKLPWTIALIVVTGMFAYLSGVFRHELPVTFVAMLLAAGAAMIWRSFGSEVAGRLRWAGGALLLTAAVFMPTVLSNVIYFQQTSSETYAELAHQEVQAALATSAPSSAPLVAQEHISLGLSLVVQQPIYIRALVGPPYLWLFPIPAWAGLGSGQVYHLFKSLNALYMALLIPAFLTAAFIVRRRRTDPSGTLLFCFFCTVGFTLMIAISSLETRHLASFLPFAFFLVASMDWSAQGNRLLLRRFAIVSWIGLVAVYLAWLILKAIL